MSLSSTSPDVAGRKLIRNKYRTRSRACGEAARSMREDHKGLPAYGPVRPLDYIPLPLGHRSRDCFVERRFGLADRPLELSQQRIHSLHRFDRVTDVDVRWQGDLIQRLACRPAIREVDVVVRRLAKIGLGAGALPFGRPGRK